MATTKPEFYTSGYETSNTLAGQLARIQDYVQQLRHQAAYLGDTALDATLAAVATNINDETQTPDLKGITEALLRITNQVPTLDGNTVQLGSTKEIKGKSTAQTIEIPAGYYGNKTTFTVESLANSSSVKTPATAADILDGKQGWVNGEKITGTSTTDLSKKLPEEKSEVYKASEGESKTLVIDLKGSAEGAESKLVTTGIPYAPSVPETITVKKVKSAENGDETSLAESITIPAGYYPTAVTVKAKVENAEGTPEFVLNAQETLDISGNQTTFNAQGEAILNPSNGFDYIETVKIHKAVISDKNALTGGYSVTQAGWINTTDDLSGLGEGSYYDNAHAEEGDNGVTIDTTAHQATITKKVHGYTPDSIVVNLPKSTAIQDVNDVISLNSETKKATFSTTINIPAGYYAGQTVTVSGEQDLNDIAGTHKFTTAYAGATETEKAEAIVITDQYVKDELTNGFYTADAKVYKVRDAVVSEFAPTGATEASNGKITIKTSTSGWFNQATVELNANQVDTLVSGLGALAGSGETSGTLAYESTNTRNSVAIANADNATVSAAAGKFYNKVDLSSLLAGMKAV